jgi:uncharacterized UBP type Zn finger protein
MPATKTNMPLIGEPCSHLAELDAAVAPRAQACEECRSERSLRVCLTCGHVGCCDAQQAHATAHAQATGHQVIESWRGGTFVFCYEHGYL